MTKEELLERAESLITRATNILDSIQREYYDAIDIDKPHFAENSTKYSYFRELRDRCQSLAGDIQYWEINTECGAKEE